MLAVEGGCKTNVGTTGNQIEYTSEKNRRERKAGDVSWSEEGSPKFKYLVTLLSKVKFSGIFTLLEYLFF